MMYLRHSITVCRGTPEEHIWWLRRRTCLTCCFSSSILAGNDREWGVKFDDCLLIVSWSETTHSCIVCKNWKLRPLQPNKLLSHVHPSLDSSPLGNLCFLSSLKSRQLDSVDLPPISSKYATPGLQIFQNLHKLLACKQCTCISPPPTEPPPPPPPPPPHTLKIIFQINRSLTVCEKSIWSGLYTHIYL